MRAGRNVRAVSRGGRVPKGAQGVADPPRAAAAAAGASVPYHGASPPYTKWPELFPALTRYILGAAEPSGAKLVSPTTSTRTARLTVRRMRTCLPSQVAARAGFGSRWPPSR